MAANEILFKELPFRPKDNEVFYIENGYDETANSFIRRNYVELNAMFAGIGMDFCYLPFLMKRHNIEAKVRYYAPYLSPKPLTADVRSNAFVPYLPDDDSRRGLKPSLVFGGRRSECGDGVRFCRLELSEIDLTGPDAIGMLKIATTERREAWYEAIWRDGVCFADWNCCNAYDVAEDDNCDGAMPSPSAISPIFDESAEDKDCVYHEVGASADNKPMAKHILYSLNWDKFVESEDKKKEANIEKNEEDLADEHSLVETAKVLRTLRATVQKLRLEGVSLMAIHEFIDKQEPLSRMTITPDHRIFLPDYNNMEIEMGALPKAVYFLYLRHPEGIICKHMQDYYNELLDIYTHLRPNTDKARLILTITKVVNPLGNALNENIARVRKAFVEKFDEHLANNYIITGERGERYAIRLDRALVEGMK